MLCPQFSINAAIRIVGNVGVRMEERREGPVVDLRRVLFRQYKPASTMPFTMGRFSAVQPNHVPSFLS